MQSVVGSVRARRLLGIGAVVLALAVPAACGGSQLSPEQVKSANDALNSNGGGNSNNNVGPNTPGATGGPGNVNPNTPGQTNAPGAPGATSTGGTNNPGTPNIPPGVPPVKAGSGIKAGSCDNFKNGNGISDSTIKIGNSSDVSGPVPGLFAGAQTATKAYVKYFNSTVPNGICGRKLELTTLDSRTDASADQTSYAKLCESVFAAVGSMSAFDSGGAQTAQSCGLPDIRSAAVTAARNNCTTCFGAQATGPYEFSNAVPDFFVKNYKDASQKAAFLALSVGAAAENAGTQQKVEEKRGMKFLYSARIDVAAFDYSSYVQQMKSKGVQWVQFLGAYQQSVRLAQAMKAGGFKPQVLLYDPSVYDNAFLTTGGSAVEGAFMFINFLPLDSNQTELNLYRSWLGQVSPGEQPTFFGAFAWSAAKLFVERSIALGGKLNRASLVAAVKPIHKWEGGGMHGPMDVGGKHSPSCIRFMRVQGGKFVPTGGTKYMCNGASVGR